MEMNYPEYVKHMKDLLDEETINEAVKELKTLGKFVITDDGRWQPVHYEGYTLITPAFGSDGDNTASYGRLLEVKKELSEKVPLTKCVEAPDNALHMTVARLISGEAFGRTMQGIGENSFLDYLKAFFSRQVVQGPLYFEIKGVSVFPQGVVAAMVGPVNENDFTGLRHFRDSIYSDKILKDFGVERKRRFNGHITLFYIEKELDGDERQKLADAMIQMNRLFFSEALPFCIRRAEVRKFNDFSAFAREKDWAVYVFA